MTFGLIVTILCLALLFILYKLLLVVHVRERYLIERLGKFKRVLEPGLHLLIPFIDRVAYRHEAREQCLNIPNQSCISKDNIQIDVDGLLYIKVMDAYKASYGIENYLLAAINLAKTTVRSEIGKLTLGTTFSERDALNETIVREIDQASDAWGIKVMRYEVMNITPSATVIDTLEKQMEAERQKRAEITLANAERDSTIALSEGARQEAINLSEGERQKKINESQGKAREISILADATALGTKLIADAISRPGGRQAMNVRLIESYIDRVAGLFQHADISVVPQELAKMEGFFAGIDQVSRSMNPATASSRQEGI